MWFAGIVTPQSTEEIAVHSDIVTLQFKNQTMISHRECARLLGKSSHHVSRDIFDLQTSLANAELQSEFVKGFFLVSVDKELYPNLDKNQKPKRGRPRSPEWLMNYKGFFWLASKYNTIEALEWKSKVLRALELGHEMAAEVLPAMQAEISQLRAENESLKANPPKQIAGHRKGQLPMPRMEYNLFGEKEIVAWEWQSMDQVDDLLITMAKLRHCNTIAAGLEHRKKELTDKLVEEELMRRTVIKDVTQKHFSLPATKKTKKKGKTQ
jgi:phage regulator Rha-like protein